MKPYRNIRAACQLRGVTSAAFAPSRDGFLLREYQLLQHSQFSVSLRRPRNYRRRFKGQDNMPSFGKLDEPYSHGEENMEDYLKKTSLSPWAPVPDSVARKMMDLAKAGSTDFHADLGSGDGRVNFHAIDYGVPKSLGVDIDENIVQLARERLSKRHPPPDLEFVVADLLLDTEHPVWLKIQQATIITMYFAEEALRKFRPVLERKLAGRVCKILTCGYEMPGWRSRVSEVVLGTQIHVYEWGTESEERNDLELFAGEDILQQKLSTYLPLQQQIEGNKFAGSKVIDHTGKSRIQGYNPNLKFEEEDDDEDWDAVSSDDEEENEQNQIKPDEVKKTTSSNSK